MAESPYINWFTSDFLNGVMDLSADQIGVYAVVLNLIADKGAPIDDDPRWIARRTGCRNTRHANRIVGELVALGKLERRNGLIGNKRMLKEVRRRGAKSDQARDAANAKWDRWRADHRPQLPLGESPVDESDSVRSQKTGQKSGRFSATNRNLTEQKNIEEKTDESHKSAIPEPADAADSRAGANPDPESIERTIESDSIGIARESESSDGSVDRSFDSEGAFVRLFERVSEAAGFIPGGTTSYATATEQLRDWLRLEGIDPETTILPCIRATMARSGDDRTSSLKRFDRAVRHEHARQSALRTNGSQPAKPPPDPILEHPEESPELADFRRAAFEQLGPWVFDRFANHALFEPERQPNGRLILFALFAPNARRITIHDDELAFARIARRHGFDDLWARTRRLSADDETTRATTGTETKPRAHARDGEGPDG